MNAVNTRRWRAFLSNRRAFWSLCLFGLVFLLSLGAEFIANDKPLLVSFKGRLIFPLFQELTEEDFGGEMPFRVDFRDEFILAGIEADGWAIWPPLRQSFNSISRKPGAVFPSPPGLENPLGTDDHGRDVLARTLYGFRLSVLFGLCLAVCGGLAGLAAGVAQGYYGGAADLLFQRFMEIWHGVPVLYLIIIISSMVSMNFWLLLAVMLLFGWMGLVGVARIESLRVRNMEYVRAARALGVSDARIMLRHVLPNALTAVLAVLPFHINGSIVALTSLDFLGFGLPSSYPSLGELAAQGKNNLHAPWIGLTSFFTLAGMLVCLVFIGEGARDAFDPRALTHNEVPGEDSLRAKEEGGA